MEASWTKSADECLQYFDVQAEVTFYHKNCLNRPIMIFYDENSEFYAPKIAGFYDQSQLRRSDFDSNYFLTNHLFFLLSYATAPICPPFGPPQKRGQGVEIRKNGGHLTVLSRCSGAAHVASCHLRRRSWAAIGWSNSRPAVYEKHNVPHAPFVCCH